MIAFCLLALRPLLSALLWLLALGSPPSAFLTDQVDIIEVNHRYDEEGKHVFDQLLFWEWDRATERWRSVWREKDGTLRRVLARSARHTWTQHDPEMDEREMLPMAQRRGLAR